VHSLFMEGFILCGGLYFLWKFAESL